jgi:hypothetical protein
MSRRPLRPHDCVFLELLFAVAESGGASGGEPLPFIQRAHEWQRRPQAVAMDAYAGRLTKDEIAGLAKWYEERKAERERSIAAYEARRVGAA